jgi:DNA (cytosine-5)-methyltransferase 1
MMTIGSLFSGIGLFEHGLERAGLGPVVWQVELNPKSRLVLEHHWPGVQRHEDVRNVGGSTLAPVDLICGGFPCEDTSSAGKKAGLDGARSGLWFEFRRIVSELRPRWVVVENVTSGASRWVDAVVEGLEQLGYACLPIPIAASDCGAPHRRARVFIVATNAHSGSQSDIAQHAEVASAPALAADAYGQPSRSAARSTGKEAVATELPADADSTGVRDERPNGNGAAIAAGDCEQAADPLRARLEGARPDAHESGLGPAASHWRSPEPDMVRVVHGRAARVDGRNARSRIEALGKAVVPQCAEVIGWVVRELAGCAP